MPAGTSALQAERRGGWVVFTVTDDGVGIPRDVMPTIFEPFEAHASQGRRGGAGLGLSIVKSLVELHGGEVEIRSEEGKGTTAIVRLPVAAGRGGRRRRIGRAWRMPRRRSA